MAKKSESTEIAKKQPDAMIVGFNYDAITDMSVVKRLQETVASIRDRMNRTFEDRIGIGQDLLEAKDSLEHGQWVPWLQAEFGMSIRTAQGFMSLAERVGSKSAKIAHLPIQPSAALLLAAPSVPEKAFLTAIKRAEDGENISVGIAKEIREAAMNKAGKNKPKNPSTQRLGLRLGTLLERQKGLWKPGDYPKLARLLREFADELVGRKSGTKKPKK